MQTMPEGSEDRKGVPLTTGVIDYFPAALAEVARVSKFGNDKHNPGQPLHHARGKSMDHADCIARHLVDRGLRDPDTGMLHSAELAWRALALLQQELEDDAGAPLARGAVLPVLRDADRQSAPAIHVERAKKELADQLRAGNWEDDPVYGPALEQLLRKALTGNVNVERIMGERIQRDCADIPDFTPES